MSEAGVDPHQALFGEPAAAECFSPQGCLQSMLDVEAALAVAEARAGVIPATAADATGLCSPPSACASS